MPLFVLLLAANTAAAAGTAATAAELQLADCTFRAEPGATTVTTTCTLDQVASLADRVDALEAQLALLSKSVTFPPQTPPPASPPPPPTPPTMPPPASFQSLVSSYTWSSQHSETAAICDATSCPAMWRTTCSTVRPWVNVGFGDTGNAAGQNWIMFEMKSPVRVFSFGGFASSHSGGMGRYWGTATFSGSMDGTSWTQLASVSGGGQCAQMGPVSTTDSTTAFPYFKVDFCCNPRGTYHSFNSLSIATTP